MSSGHKRDEQVDSKREMQRENEREGERVSDKKKRRERKKKKSCTLACAGSRKDVGWKMGGWGLEARILKREETMLCGRQKVESGVVEQ